GRLGKLLRPLGRVEDELRPLELADEVRTDLSLGSLGALGACRGGGKDTGEGGGSRDHRGVAEEFTSGWLRCHGLGLLRSGWREERGRYWGRVTRVWAMSRLKALRARLMAETVKV